jgi:phospholipase/carboxylesterase
MSHPKVRTAFIAGSRQIIIMNIPVRSMPSEQCTFIVGLECRYLLHVPDLIVPHQLIVLALHGYGSNAEDMLRLTTALVGEHHVVASLQAPNQHYAGLPNAESAPAYNWGIRQHWQSSVRLHHNMVQNALAALRDRFGAGPERCLLVGFSQPVGLNYRFIATHPVEVAGVIGICGGVPRDWEEDKYQAVQAAVLHISRDEDEFYPRDVVSTFRERLRRRATDVEFHLLSGRHRFPSKADRIVRPWMERVFRKKLESPKC